MRLNTHRCSFVSRYYEDSLAWAIFMSDVQRESSKPYIVPMAQFYDDAKTGNLANFTFLEPRISPNANASHDPTSVTLCSIR